jgi:hypothetical protein
MPALPSHFQTLLHLSPIVAKVIQSEQGNLALLYRAVVKFPKNRLSESFELGEVVNHLLQRTTSIFTLSRLASSRKSDGGLLSTAKLAP